MVDDGSISRKHAEILVPPLGHLQEGEAPYILLKGVCPSRRGWAVQGASGAADGVMASRFGWSSEAAGQQSAPPGGPRPHPHVRRARHLYPNAPRPARPLLRADCSRNGTQAGRTNELKEDHYMKEARVHDRWYVKFGHRSPFRCVICQCRGREPSCGGSGRDMSNVVRQWGIKFGWTSAFRRGCIACPALRGVK